MNLPVNYGGYLRKKQRKSNDRKMTVKKEQTNPKQLPSKKGDKK